MLLVQQSYCRFKSFKEVHRSFSSLAKAKRQGHSSKTKLRLFLSLTINSKEHIQTIYNTQDNGDIRKFLTDLTNISISNYNH